MTAKEYLLELRWMNAEIEQLQEQKQMYMDMATSVNVPFSSVKVQTSRCVDRIGDNVSKADEMENKIEDKINNLWSRQQDIIKMIQSLRNADYMRVLFKVYVQFKTIKQAAAEMGRSYPYTLELHKKALEAFEITCADILALEG
ncbi:MAG: hypothetical protein ACI4EI_08065 [Muricoprocola sp.]